MHEEGHSDIVDVAAAIIEKEGKILIAKRRAKEKLESKWEFPGGKIEKGETPEACLVRELKEELDLQIRVLRCFSVRTHILSPERKLRLHTYIAEYIAGIPTLKEHEDARWVSKEELLSFNFYEPDLLVVKDLLQIQ
jgi:8-oxo-dGTP diphosphatase